MFFPKAKSQVFEELSRQYEIMHSGGYNREGADAKQAEETYAGDQLPHYAIVLGRDFKKHDVKSYLDYGCGKGEPHSMPKIKTDDGMKTFPDAMGVHDFALYDAGVEEFQTMPERMFDAVISTDVLEHIPVEDIYWVVDEMFSKANKYVFASIAAYPAMAILPDGRNAHVTLRNPHWWCGVFETLARAHKKHFRIVVLAVHKNPDGTGRVEPYQFEL